MSDVSSGTGQLIETVRLFPLPNVVLFPKAVLPLHIFEERYKQMTADALEGDGRVAMALLRPGWEKQYYASPAIEPVVCVGRILSHERLPDGKYNFLLEGTHRARVVKELNGEPYRRAQVEVLREPALMEIDLACERYRLVELFAQSELGRVGAHYLHLAESPLKTGEVADLIAFNLIEDVGVKQALLADVDVVRRVRRVVEMVEGMMPALRRAAREEGEADWN